MTITLRDFIASRETAIKEQIKALRLELTELKAAKNAMDSATSAIDSPSTQTGAKTIKDMIREIMKSSETGLTSTEILAKIGSSFNRQLERTSLSPQLSRMKDDGEVLLVDNSWVLAGRENDNYRDEEKIAEFGEAPDSNNYAPAILRQDFDEEFDSDVPF